MNPEYIAHHLLGAWRLLRGDETGFDHFDLTEDGFWKSFSVMGFALPILVLGLILSHQIFVEFAVTDERFNFAVPFPYFAGFEIISTYAGWLIYLLVMARVADIFGAGARYSTFVITYNWANFLILLIVLPSYVAYFVGWVSTDMFLALQMFLSLAFLAYSWFIAYISLRLVALDAAAVVCIEMVIYLLLNRITSTIYDGFTALS